MDGRSARGWPTGAVPATHLLSAVTDLADSSLSGVRYSSGAATSAFASRTESWTQRGEAFGWWPTGI
jgi:hypothetical protein